VCVYRGRCGKLVDEGEGVRELGDWGHSCFGPSFWRGATVGAPEKSVN